MKKKIQQWFVMSNYKWLYEGWYAMMIDWKGLYECWYAMMMD